MLGVYGDTWGYLGVQGSPEMGVPFGGPQGPRDKSHRIRGSILTYPFLWKEPTMWVSFLLKKKKNMMRPPFLRQGSLNCPPLPYLRVQVPNNHILTQNLYYNSITQNPST